MSAMLLLRWAVPVFALAVAATVFALAGPVAAGLSLVTFLLGVVTSELHHMRWSAVEQPSHAAADSAFLALMDTEAGRATSAPGPAAVQAPEPPAVPKRDFRPVLKELAIGSGEIRLPLVERRGLHADAARTREAVRVDAPMVPAPRAPEPVSIVDREPRSFTLRASFVEQVSG